MVSLLTSTRHRETNTCRMPGADTGHLTQTLVSLTRKLLGVPARCDTFHALPLGDTDDVDHFILRENRLHRDLLLEMLADPVNLVCDRSSVQLDLHHMCFLLPLLQKLHLRMGDDAYDCTVFLQLL